MKTRHRLTILAALVMLPGLTLAQTITSGVPGFISYQGKVLNNTGGLVGAGTPVNRTVVFRVWDHPSNTLTGNLIYSEQQTVTISEGEFSVLVGQGVATAGSQFGYSETAKKLTDIGTAFGGSTRYLGVTVDDGTAAVDNEITPRQQIVSSAFSFRSKFAEALGTGGATALTVLDNGNTGIGNTNPPGRLTITNNTTTSSSGTPQLVLTDSADTNERLRLGVDSTGSGTGFIQSFKEGTGAQNLLLNPAGGNVGIGNTNPTSRLDVSGGVKASGGEGFTFNTGDADGGMFSPSDGIVTFRTNGTERMRVDSSGNLLIGATSADAKLTIGGVTSWSNGLKLTGSGTYVGMTIETTAAGGNSYSIYAESDGALRFYNNTNFSYPITVTSSGNIGIGQNSPTAKLHVNGGIRVANDNSISGLDALTGFNDLHLQGDAGVTDMYISSGGNVGIGTTNPLARFNVNGNTALGYVGSASGVLNVGVGDGWGNSTINVKSRNNDDIIMTCWRRPNATGGGGGGSECFRLEDFGGTGFAIQVMQGNAYKPGGGSWGAYSDARLKDKVENLEGALDRLLKLRSVTFEYKKVPEAGGLTGTQIGFLAQEVEQVFPQWISNSSTGYKVVNIMGFEALTVQALRELNTDKDARIAELKAAQKALSDRVEKLEAVEKKAAALQSTNAQLLDRLAKLDARDRAREARLAALEEMLLSDNPPALPVSLKDGKGAE